MIDYDNLRRVVVKGLKQYLGCPIIRSNQNAAPPPYPYGSYTITAPLTQNRGTYGEYADGVARKPVTPTMSLTFQSDKNVESVTLANQAREWLDYVGTTYLNDNNVIVQSVGAVANRDNFLTIEYEHRNGFDVEFWVYDEVATNTDAQTIEVMEFGDDSNVRLENRLDGVSQSEYGLSQTAGEDSDELTELLNKRLNGVE